MKAKILTITLGALGAIGIIGTGINAGDVNALSYQKNVDVGFTLEPSVSIKLSSSELTISDLAPGQNADSNIITLTVESNNANGYTVGSTVGGTKNETTYDNSNLQHSSNYDSTKSISYFQSLGTSDSIAELADLTAGKWGYSFNLNNGSWSSYSGLPFNDGETASAELVNVGTNAESSIQFKIAAAAQDRQYSGEYNNIVNFTTTVNMAPAVTYMQNWTGCSNLSSGDTATLTDSRDNTEYTVGKLADNNCWMLDNLALDLTNSDILDSLSSSNTNINKDNESAILTSLKSGNRSAGNQYATAGVSNWTSSYSYSAPLVNLTNKDVVPQGSDPMASTVAEGGWKTGGFYNYCAASAGTYCYGNGTSYTGSPSDTQNGVRNIDADICPAGWRMPTGNTSGEFYALATAITGTAGSQTNANYTNFRTAFRYPLPGYFYNGSTSSQGSYGIVWSSTRDSDRGMYGLYASTSTVYPAGNSGRGDGSSLRCILGS